MSHIWSDVTRLLSTHRGTAGTYKDNRSGVIIDKGGRHIICNYDVCNARASFGTFLD